MREQFLIRLNVRHVSSGKFFRATGGWTRRAETAFNFPNLLSAINTCFARGLRNVELIVRYKDDLYDRAIPMRYLMN